jgi:pyruvate/2-oxoglutarate dehydrogenase complex dihydrolipoamide dehydrogenase (E3) component
VDELYRLAVIGAGLSALSALRAAMAHGSTILLDYQAGPGGFLRSALPAVGFEDAWELLRAYEVPPGVELRTGTTVVGLLPAAEPNAPHLLLARSRQGTVDVRAQRILIASGGLEITREQAQIPGSRPAGVITPILAHQLLARGYLPGRQIVVHGHSHYAAATAYRLAEAGAEVTLIPPAGTSAPAVEGSVRAEAPAELTEVIGFPRLECIRLRRAGQLLEYPADTLVYAVGMVANTHWLKGSGIATRPNGAIQVGGTYQTSVPGIYAIGTVVAPSLDHVHSIAMGKEVASILAGEAP